MRVLQVLSVFLVVCAAVLAQEKEEEKLPENVPTDFAATLKWYADKQTWIYEKKGNTLVLLKRKQWVDDQVKGFAGKPVTWDGFLTSIRAEQVRADGFAYYTDKAGLPKSPDQGAARKWGTQFAVIKGNFIAVPKDPKDPMLEKLERGQRVIIKGVHSKRLWVVEQATFTIVPKPGK